MMISFQHLDIKVLVSIIVFAVLSNGNIIKDTEFTLSLASSGSSGQVNLLFSF